RLLGCDLGIIRLIQIFSFDLPQRAQRARRGEWKTKMDSKLFICKRCEYIIDELAQWLLSTANLNF
ncbi:hypothetical protein, partial [Microcoleus sp. bin38.metabat.b11b12b14.051]|uniref:hypothetical protein n=1 Tax=Microcoleus sp. bin38.metabat.b11b12b14.051 TaxID=2742709 RepID=UPI0025DA2039